MPIIYLIYTCHIPVLTLTRYNSWENNHHECKDSLWVLEAWLDAIHPLERITTWVLLENKIVWYTWYMTDIWTEMSYDIHMPDIWQVKTFYRFQMYDSDRGWYMEVYDGYIMIRKMPPSWSSFHTWGSDNFLMFKLNLPAYTTHANYMLCWIQK